MKIFKTLAIRSREEALDTVIAYRDRVEEHMYKLYAFGNKMPYTVRQWVKSLNSYLHPLRRANAKNGKRTAYNLRLSVMQQLLVEQTFSSTQDLDSWNQHLNILDENYTLIRHTNKDVHNIQQLMQSYIDCIYGQNLFEPDTSLFKQY